MKGFIEVTSTVIGKILLNINHIECVFGEGNFTKIGTISDSNSICVAKESYEEVKKKIEEALR